MHRLAVDRRWLVPGVLGLLSGCATYQYDAATPIPPMIARAADAPSSPSKQEVNLSLPLPSSVVASTELPSSPSREKIDRVSQNQINWVSTGASHTGSQTADPKTNSGELSQFRLPGDLPGAGAAPIKVPDLNGLSAAEREKKVVETYPALPPLASDPQAAVPATGKPYRLEDLQSIAGDRSPVIRRTAHGVDVAYGIMVQAGLYPNPHAGYEADQVQPGPLPKNNSGQQGAFLQQLIKTAGKLSLAQRAAGMDYSNAQVALRRAQIDVISQVRNGYYGVLVAQETMRVNRILSQLADDVYRLQVKLVASGVAAGYEPLQLYTQAMQARVQYVRAQYRLTAAWKQLAAAMGMPDLPLQALEGRVDVPVPLFEADQSREWILQNHTDILTAQNTILRSQHLLSLAKVIPIPDITFGTAVQYDNSVGNNQFNIQVGVAIPVFDRNQGNIQAARGALAQALEDLRATQNDLTGRLAEAFGRYQTSRVTVENYREGILPNLSRAYQSIVQRHQLEPAKVPFTDIIFAQQNLATALTVYLTALGDQWTAVVDVANLLQIDNLYQALAPEKPDCSIPAFSLQRRQAPANASTTARVFSPVTNLGLAGR